MVEDAQKVIVSRRDGIVVEIERALSGGARLTVDLGCCKKSRQISRDLAKKGASPELDHMVLEIEQELISTYGSRSVWSHDATLNALRMKYKVAFEAHRQCHRLLTEATARGETPSAAMTEAEDRAKLQLNDARSRLLNAKEQAVHASDGPVL